MSAPVSPSPALPTGPAGWPAHPHADAAEEVRAWLVTARGGAPFLSASDGRRLADWLEDGVPVRDLLRAIDETSAHRRAKRLRQAFGLQSIEPALRRVQRGASPARGVRTPPPPPPDDLPWPDAGPLVIELHAFVASEPEAIAILHVSRCIREFFDAAWVSLASAHPVLLAAALEELGDLAEQLDADTRAALCEEYARERVRARYPELRSGGLLG